MKCAGQSNPVDKCGPGVKDMTSAEACEQRKEKAKGAWDAVEGMMPPMAGIINAIKSKASSDQQILNTLSINVDTKSLLEQMGKCENEASSIQVNKIVGPSPECIDAWAKAGWSVEDIK